MPPCRTGLNRRHHKKTQPPVGRGRPSANNASQPDHHWPPRPPNRTDGDCFRPDRRSDVTTALATFRSRPAARRSLSPCHGLSGLDAAGGRLLQPGDAQAEPLEAGGARRAIASMRHRPTTSARSDRPALADRAIASRGTRSSRRSAPDSFRRVTRRPRACAPATVHSSEASSAASLSQSEMEHCRPGASFAQRTSCPDANSIPRRLPPPRLWRVCSTVAPNP